MTNCMVKNLSCCLMLVINDITMLLCSFTIQALACGFIYTQWFVLNVPLILYSAQYITRTRSKYSMWLFAFASTVSGTTRASGANADPTAWPERRGPAEGGPSIRMTHGSRTDTQLLFSLELEWSAWKRGRATPSKSDPLYCWWMSLFQELTLQQTRQVVWKFVSAME